MRTLTTTQGSKIYRLIPIEEDILRITVKHRLYGVQVAIVLRRYLGETTETKNNQVQRTLQNMVKDGLLIGTPVSPPKETRQYGKRIYYQVTPLGKDILDKLDTYRHTISNLTIYDLSNVFLM